MMPPNPRGILSLPVQRGTLPVYALGLQTVTRLALIFFSDQRRPFLGLTEIYLSILNRTNPYYSATFYTWSKRELKIALMAWFAS